MPPPPSDINTESIAVALPTSDIPLEGRYINFREFSRIWGYVEKCGETNWIRVVQTVIAGPGLPPPAGPPCNLNLQLCRILTPRFK